MIVEKKYYMVIVGLLLITFLNTSCIKKSPDPSDVGKFNIAITNNDYKKVKFYIKHFNNMSNYMFGIELTRGVYEQWSPIMLTVYYNKDDTDILNLLVKNGGDINYMSSEGFSAFHIASMYNNTKALRYLINKGIDVNFLNNDGETALFPAISFKYIDAIQLLLENKIDINVKSNFNDYTVYHIIPWLEDISEEDRLEMFRLLTRYDPSSLDSPSRNGRTPFCLALSFGQYYLIDFFLEHGASVSKALNCCDAYDTHYMPLLHRKNKEYMIKLLDNCDGLLDGKDEDGYTLLMLGVLALNHTDIDYEILKLLAEKSENIEQEDIGGTTAFMMAVAMNRLDIARLLINMGADKYHVNKSGQNAIIYHEVFSKELGFPINTEIYSLF